MSNPLNCNLLRNFRWFRVIAVSMALCQDTAVSARRIQQPHQPFEGEAVFVGHGITAPEFQWDDFRGVDVKNKILVLFTNEPPSSDAKFFDGRALTYYGRWTYKYEEGLRRGAQGVLII